MNRWRQIRQDRRAQDRRGGGPLYLGAVLALATFLAAPPAPAERSPGENLYVAARTECLAPGFEELACGGAGTYFVGPGEDCAQSKVDISGSGLYPRTPQQPWLRSAGETWSPCAGGGCFNDDPRGPWVAVVDWGNGHGGSVGETVLQASGYSVEVRLFALEASGLEAVDRLPSVNDAHVLAQLCRVAVAAAVRKPVAVNMSFGRLDAASCELRRSLTCEIDRVIRHLREDLGIPLFAAAGHEGQLLYPAAHPGVLAVGSVDVTHLAATGRARPLPQTPRGFGALLAGQGVYLEERSGNRVWAAPPGSSYASALAAGWWAGYRIRKPALADKLLELCGGPLVPAVVGGRAHLACGSLVLPESDLAGPNALLRTALGKRPGVCGRTEAREVRRLDVAGPASPGATPRLTLADAQAHLARPAPDSRPCVPCHGSGGGGDNGSGGGSAKADLEDEELIVDLSASGALPEELELLGIHLQVGRSTYRFSDSKNPLLLGDLALGKVERLRLRNMPRRPRAPVAFVFTLRPREGGPAFRATTPILVHQHRKEL